MTSDPHGKMADSAAPGSEEGTSQEQAARAPAVPSKPQAAARSIDSAEAPGATQSQTAATSIPSGRADSAASPAQGAQSGTANNLATWESSASNPPAETTAAGTEQASATETGASSSAGTKPPGSADAVMQAEHENADEAAGRNALADNAASGATGASSNASDSSLTAAKSETGSGAAQAAPVPDLTGAAGSAQAGTTSLTEGGAQTADAAGKTGTGSTSGAAAAGPGTAGEGGTGLDQTTAAGSADQAASGASTSTGASEGGGALSQEQTTKQDEQAAKQNEEVIVGLVETPGKKATPTETVIPQTLGGMLPLTLGVDGEGEFDFDKAVLREQVRTVLDELVAKLQNADYDRLEIVGHTDRIGTDVYNQYLSERRAWAVARYLIQKGVPVTKLQVEGRGMSEPVTTANACEGLSREQTIACLQEDRRVVISASIRRVDVNVH